MALARWIILTLAFWCALFALAATVQIAVVAAPPAVQLRLFEACALLAAVYAPVATFIVTHGKAAR